MLSAADGLAATRLTPTERRRLRPAVAELLEVGHEPDALSAAIAAATVRTAAGVEFELGRRRQADRARADAPRGPRPLCHVCGTTNGLRELETGDVERCAECRPVREAM